jgi:hypothetical protein
MSRKLSGSRSKSILSESLDQRLKMYSLAAAAAGVSLLALAQPAGGEVVVTRTSLPVTGYEGPVYIKMTGEGEANFEIQASTWFSYDGGIGGNLEVITLNHGGVIGGPSRSGSYASKLSPGATIGPSAQFSPQKAAIIERSGWVVFYCWPTLGYGVCEGYPVYYGQWAGTANGYLGVRFLLDNQIHYGWIRLTVESIEHGRARITAYAYETEPDTPIVAGPPTSDNDAATQDGATPESQNVGNVPLVSPSLGMLASGSNGLALWRH